MARRILILFAHPVAERSRVGWRLAEAAAEVEGVTVHDLYERYPRFDLDVPREQALLTSHDVIVWQHPFYWYSVPALLKEWADLVLEHGWAYGDGGDALRDQGKLALSCVTTGGPASAYQPGGYNRFTMRQLLSPWDQTAHLCGLRYLAPFVVHGSLRLAGAEDLAPHLARYQRLLAALRDDEVDLDAAAGAEYLDLTHLRGAAA
ncbi:MAG: NAD(P)H-dependent oxidoreductase [Kofleriaceae bacterium]